MKHFLFILCVMFPLVTDAQTGYEIFKIQGDVIIRRQGSAQWESVTPFMGVEINDTIKLSKGSSVTILEKDSRRLFASSEMGSFTLSSRLHKAERNEETVFNTLNKKIVRLLKKENKSHKPYVSNAAASRGDGQMPEYDLYDSVCADIIQYGLRGTGSNCEDVYVRKINMDDSTFGITVKNESENLLFFNMLVFKDDKLQTCFRIEDMDLIPLPSNTTLNLTPFPLYDNGDKYIFFALETNLYLKLLEYSLNNISEIKPMNVRGLKIKVLF